MPLDGHGVIGMCACRQQSIYQGTVCFASAKVASMENHNILSTVVNMQTSQAPVQILMIISALLSLDICGSTPDCHFGLVTVLSRFNAI